MAENEQQFPHQPLPLPCTTSITTSNESADVTVSCYHDEEASLSPARPSKSPDLPEETSGKGLSFLPMTDGEKVMDGEKPLVSLEMEEEENKLEAENREEEEKIRSSLRERRERDNLQEQRYKRLMHLLTKSQFYSEFLLEQIESQKAAHKDRSDSSQDTEATSSQSEGSGMGSQESQGSGGGGKRKRGRGGGGRGKRRKEEKSYQIVDVIDEDTVKKHAEGAREEDEGEAIERVKQPLLFENGVMRAYQLDGFSWLLALYENGINGILGDEMGLGKTIQFIALVCYLVEQGVAGPFFVCAPLSTLPNWMAEFERFAPKVPTLLYHGPESERVEKRHLIKRCVHVEGCPKPVQPVVVTSYEVAIRDTRVLQQYNWRYVCVDEGHRLKNHKCRLTKSLNTFPLTNRLLLTGTPLQNSLAELWALLNFLMPDIFDSLDVFESWFDVMEMMEEGSNERIIQQERENQVISTMMKILSPFFLRRVKKDVKLDIPPKRELLVYTPMTPTQVKLYEATLTHNTDLFAAMKKKEEDTVEYDDKGRPMRKTRRPTDYLSFYLQEEEEEEGKEEAEEEERLRTFFEASMKNEGENKSASPPVAKTSRVRVKLQNKMMQLRRVVNHPYLIEYPLNADETFRVDEGLVESCGKMQVLDQLLGELYRRRHRVLLFTQMTSLMDILEDYLTLRPQYRYRRLDGSRKLEERQSDIRDFNRAGSDDFLFLLSTRAGGLGLNLASADTVIIYDSDWNPQCDLQAQDRCHRIGQTNPVLVLRLITASSIDERIVERAATKRKLEKLIIQRGKFRAANQGERSFQRVMNEGELLALLKERDHEREHRASKGHVFTQKELDQLLDRSDLTSATKWKRRREEKERDWEEEEEKKLEGVFKVILEEG